VIRVRTSEVATELMVAKLRAQGINATILRDDDLLGVWGPRYGSQFSIVVPGHKERAARAILGIGFGDGDAGPPRVAIYLLLFAGALALVLAIVAAVFLRS